MLVALAVFLSNPSAWPAGSWASEVLEAMAD
jgi:hypothetical protein